MAASRKLALQGCLKNACLHSVWRLFLTALLTRVFPLFCFRGNHATARAPACAAGRDTDSGRHTTDRALQRFQAPREVGKDTPRSPGRGGRTRDHSGRESFTSQFYQNVNRAARLSLECNITPITVYDYYFNTDTDCLRGPIDCMLLAALARPTLGSHRSSGASSRRQGPRWSVRRW